MEENISAMYNIVLINAIIIVIAPNIIIVISNADIKHHPLSRDICQPPCFLIARYLL
ncbi:MAG: hypothetical protein FWE44_06260 [Defluviitaleaceae bacterium]|nr:hypothetical protein [Defluviitaleaceae bacterium]